MRRYASVLVLLVGLLLFSGYGVAQEDVPAGLVREDLQLISQESLSHWTPVWTGPIQAATVMAWFADHEYSRLMRDFNDDGVIDELDTIELANDFGLGIMEVESLRGATDVRLVVGLANYVAHHYPGEFVLKIYDLSFSHEFSAQGFGVFEANAIPGIVLQLEGEPSISAYIYEMATDEGVIIGIEEELNLNRYFAGRSYLIEEIVDGYTPLDFAWAKEDAWRTGHQGQVLQTVGRMDNRFYLEFMNEWRLVEFMLALSPLDEEEGPPDDTNEGCPDLAIGILDEICVYNEKTETYDITIWAEVLNIGTEPVTSPFIVVLNCITHPCGAVQLIPIPPVFNPGDVIPITMSFSTPPDPSGAAPCPLDYRIMVDARLEIDECDEENNIVFGDVCCGDEEGDCPDLVVEIIEKSCVVEPIPGAPMGQSVLTVNAKITNIGGGVVVVPTTALLRGLGPYTMFMMTTPVPPLGAGDAHSVLLSFAIPSDEPVCPLDFVIAADAYGDVGECDEHNNSVYDTVCCQDEFQRGACCFRDGSCAEMTAQECEAQGGTEFHPDVDCSIVQCPQPGTTCPDLILVLDDIDCDYDYDPRKQTYTYEFTITVLVQNIGTQTITDPIWLEATADAASSTKVIHTDLDPGDSTDVEFTFGTSPNNPCIDVTFEVDYLDSIVECEEDNNMLSVSECCN